ncbi:TRAP transporter large permease [Ponticoccus alexandrii]|uniref:TRAP transporter large permease protein n=1 Tax=Ponticoccus alexandrii TaxID=1943633 RepID=A0ABX7FA60_9RHOB|nr:TRAP transporter large permease [Ponticoccus alexandrii]KID12419.1 C4-dicarboxylate ABC transporter permease [Rhodobacteraceae bacterium PD-2]QRF67428.1 TRAP transporter large permease subunit [Ponticoccus alexandrii]
MSNELLAVSGFVALFALMALRVPIGIAMGLVGIGGFGAVIGMGPALNLLAQSPISTITDFNLTLIPFFILMGVLATNSGMSSELFRAGRAWLGGFRGGLGLASVGACGGFAAICGSSVATAATMTKIAYPEMKQAGYSDAASTGIIAAGGTLGILIPPSVVLAIYGFITETDIGQLFIAGVVPGLLAIVMYMLTVRYWYGRQLPAAEPFRLGQALAALKGIWAVGLLFIAVILSIYFGVVTATEAAAVGALLTALIGLIRRRLTLSTLLDSLVEALRTSVSIYVVLIGATLFGYFLAITQVPQEITSFLTTLGAGRYGTLLLILLLFLVMGCFLDAMAMIILMVPIVVPVIEQLGFDPIWFGIIIVMTVELGLITPPVGMNVYVINSIASRVSLTTIFRGVLPFVTVDVLRLILLIAFPALVMALPNSMN